MTDADGESFYQRIAPIFVLPFVVAAVLTLLLQWLWEPLEYAFFPLWIVLIVVAVAVMHFLEGDSPVEGLADSSMESEMMELLDRAEQAGAAGNTMLEEERISEARHVLADKSLRKQVVGMRWLWQEMERRIDAGTLRRGANLIGVVGQGLMLYSDRIVRGNEHYPMDQHVSASVEIDGQVFQSSRITLTRAAAAGFILPGSALIVGLAFPKRKIDDQRSASFNLAHPTWTIRDELDPDVAHETRPIAAQVNAIAKELTTSSATPPPAAAEQETSHADRLNLIEQISQMERDGKLSPAQASKMRDQIVGDN